MGYRGQVGNAGPAARSVRQMKDSSRLPIVSGLPEKPGLVPGFLLSIFNKKVGTEVAFICFLISNKIM